MTRQIWEIQLENVNLMCLRVEFFGDLVYSSDKFKKLLLCLHCTAFVCFSTNATTIQQQQFKCGCSVPMHGQCSSEQELKQCHDPWPKQKLKLISWPKHVATSHDEELGKVQWVLVMESYIVSTRPSWHHLIVTMHAKCSLLLQRSCYCWQPTTSWACSDNTNFSIVP